MKIEFHKRVASMKQPAEDQTISAIVSGSLSVATGSQQENGTAMLMPG